MDKYDKPPATPSPKSVQEEKEFFTSPKKAINHVIIIAIYILGFCFALMFIVRVAHFIIGTKYHWLSETQIQQIDRFLFSGIAGALVGKYVDGMLKNSK